MGVCSSLFCLPTEVISANFKLAFMCTSHPQAIIIGHASRICDSALGEHFSA